MNEPLRNEEIANNKKSFPSNYGKMIIPKAAE